MTSTTTASAVAPPLSSPMPVPYRRYALGLLVAIYTVNFLDRQIVTILIPDIKRDLNLSDSEVGAMAGLFSRSRAVGFVGGMDIPLIRRFEHGFSAGVRATCPACRFVASYAGSTPAAFKAGRLFVSCCTRIFTALSGFSMSGYCCLALDHKRPQMPCTSLR